MAESTLSLSYDDFAKEVGGFLGYGRDSTAWSTNESDLISDIIQSGLRQFYYPPPLPGERKAHEWRFLRPAATLVAWPTTSTTLDGPNTTQTQTSTCNGAISGTTVTANDAIFAAYQIGETITINAVNYTIASVTSTTVCETTTSVTASDTDAITVQVTKVTADAAIFYDSAVGKNLTIGSNSYEILSVTSTTVAMVSGNASAETDEATVTLTADGDYRLPDDFGGIDGDFTFGESEGWVALRIGTEGQIRKARQTAVGARRPQRAAIRPLALDPLIGQRFEVMLWPIPDSVYNFGYRYNVLMGKLTSDQFPYGGMQHGETILQSCLAAAELRADDEEGVQWKRFIARLMASVELDRSASAPEFYGYASDNSDEADKLDITRVTGVTYEGTQY